MTLKEATAAVGVKHGALWAGMVPMTIGAVGRDSADFWIQAIDDDGTVTLGSLDDFTLPAPPSSPGAP